MHDTPRLGFACLWGAQPERTWSGTPWALRRALSDELEVVDVGPAPSLPARATLKSLSLRRQGGRWVTPWRWSAAWEHVAHRSVQRSVRRRQPDALLQIGDFGRYDLPYFLYQDLNYDVLHARIESGGVVPGFQGVSRAVVEGRRARQRDLYAGAAGVFAMSDWFAEVLMRDSGVPAEKVHVARAGIHASPPSRLPEPPTVSDRGSLLFLGRDFERKGGSLVVEAVELLRQGGSSVTLTIAGPAAWPLSRPQPKWVTHVGDVDPSRVSELLLAADLMVLPSRFEAFGIAFAEARAHGVPCIGRRAFAMPELITDGSTGALVDSDDVAALAAAIERVLRDDSIYERCAAEAAQVAAYYSWEQVAKRVASVITGALR